jgi:uncharacterized membrane protein (UPF0127 family)
MASSLSKFSVGFTSLILAGLVLVFVWPSQGLTKVDVNGREFTVKIASTAAEREKGLSGQPKLADNQGMLFKFDKPEKYTFWMNGMLFPLDILFIKDGRIVDMAIDMPAPKKGENIAIYTSKAIADSVLEVNAGTAARLEWSLGSRVTSP